MRVRPPGSITAELPVLRNVSIHGRILTSGIAGRRIVMTSDLLPEFPLSAAYEELLQYLFIEILKEFDPRGRRKMRNLLIALFDESRSAWRALLRPELAKLLDETHVPRDLWDQELPNRDYNFFLREWYVYVWDMRTGTAGKTAQWLMEQNHHPEVIAHMSYDELAALPGITPARIRAILNHRPTYMPGSMPFMPSVFMPKYMEAWERELFELYATLWGLHITSARYLALFSISPDQLIRKKLEWLESLAPSDVTHDILVHRADYTGPADHDRAAYLGEIVMRALESTATNKPLQHATIVPHWQHDNIYMMRWQQASNRHYAIHVALIGERTIKVSVFFSTHHSSAYRAGAHLITNMTTHSQMSAEELMRTLVIHLNRALSFLDDVSLDDMSYVYFE